MKDKKKIFELAGNLNTAMSYAVIGLPDRFLKHRHAWQAAHVLKDFGCRVFLVSPQLKIFEGSRVYPDLAALKGKVDVIVPCLRPHLIKDIVQDTVDCEAKYIWFQEQNWTPDFEAACQENNIGVVRGCILKHKLFSKPLAFLNPCYWHGRNEKKVPGKYQRIR
ncbi:CoA-binding protein [Dehalobacter sp. DCM]|uniref:CoA-binding protein n=1 Tax=Dehalobacter sp. DCM TaxID=2907827 RepID=UPI00308125E5|nr:CoA-binding protein [Dehalobacter sp. DCM]